MTCSTLRPLRALTGDSSLEIGPESNFKGHMVHCGEPRDRPQTAMAALLCAGGSLSAVAEQLEPFGYKLAFTLE